MEIQELIERKRDEILKVAEKHGARNVRLIGSLARGEGGPDSDVDLLVDMDLGRTLLDHAALIHDLQSLLGCKVDIASSRGLRERVKARVLEEAVPL